MRSLRGVAISSSVLNFGMFAHSTTLILRLYNIYFGLRYLSQASTVLSQLQLPYLYYLELSLTAYKITELQPRFTFPSAPKGNSKFEILLVNIFSIKQKKIKYFQLL